MLFIQVYSFNYRTGFPRNKQSHNGGKKTSRSRLSARVRRGQRNDKGEIFKHIC